MADKVWLTDTDTDTDTEVCATEISVFYNKNTRLPAHE